MKLKDAKIGQIILYKPLNHEILWKVINIYPKVQTTCVFSRNEGYKPYSFFESPISFKNMYYSKVLELLYNSYENL